MVRRHEHGASGAGQASDQLAHLARCPAGRGRWSARRGSSSAGSPSSAAAMPRRCFMPSEYVRKRSSPRSARPTRSSSAGIAALVVAAERARTRRFSAPVSAGLERRALDQRADPGRGSGRVGRAARRARCRSPAVGRTSPRSIAMVVVLPAPFGPMKPATTPRGSSTVEIVDGGALAVALGQALDGEGWCRGHGSMGPPRHRRRPPATRRLASAGRHFAATPPGRTSPDS